MITQELLNEITRRLVATYNPVEIYLFGSHARGNATDDSDVDLAIVVDKIAAPRHKELARGHLALFDVEVSKDLLLYQKNDFDRLKAECTSFAYQIVKTGKKIYDQASA